MSAILKAVWSMLGGACTHQEQSWVRRDEDGVYRRCVQCGARIPYTAIQFGHSIPARSSQEISVRQEVTHKKSTAGRVTPRPPYCFRSKMHAAMKGQNA